VALLEEGVGSGSGGGVGFAEYARARWGNVAVATAADVVGARAARERRTVRQSILLERLRCVVLSRRERRRVVEVAGELYQCSMTTRRSRKNRPLNGALAESVVTSFRKMADIEFL
jgi:hypothetical protein